MLGGHYTTIAGGSSNYPSVAGANGAKGTLGSSSNMNAYVTSASDLIRGFKS